MRTNPKQLYSVEAGISTPSQIEIGEVVKTLNQLLTLAWANKDTTIIADASKLRANLAQMAEKGRTEVEYGLYAIVHAQIESINAQNARFATEIAASLTETRKVA